jgi:hypothetical protein
LQFLQAKSKTQYDGFCSAADKAIKEFIAPVLQPIFGKRLG